MQNKDETRYLAKLLAIITTLIASRIVVAQNQKLSTFTISLTANQKIDLIFSVILSIAAAFLILWLTWRLLKCKSLLNFPPFLTKNNPYPDIYKCAYLNINRHKRAGLMAGIITLITIFFLPTLIAQTTSITFFKHVTTITYKIIFAPLNYILKTFEITLPESFIPALIILATAIIFTAAFITGLTISLLKHKLTARQETASQTGILKCKQRN